MRTRARKRRLYEPQGGARQAPSDPVSKTLVIAEKPSVAQDIVRALTPVTGKFDKHDESFETKKYVAPSAGGPRGKTPAPEQYDVRRGKWSSAPLRVIPPYFDLKPVDKTKSRLNAVVKL